MRNTRCTKTTKNVTFYPEDICAFVERLKRVRALNCDPALFGMDAESVKKFSFHKFELLLKLL